MIHSRYFHQLKKSTRKFYSMNAFHLTRRCYLVYLRRTDICKIYYSTGTPLSASPDNQKLLTDKLESVKTKLYDFMKWYEQLTGLDEIRVAQNKVIEAQDRFAAAQDKRREVTLELNDVKNKIKDLQEELSSTSRGEEKYINLITKEHKFLKEEIRLTDKFNLYEREERELFTTLTSAVKDSHEKERIQANKTKYLSIIGSVIGALIGITGSTINNRSKIAELKKMVLQSTEAGKKELQSICQRLETATTSLAPVQIEDSVIKKLNEITQLLSNLNTTSKNEDIHSSLSRIEKNVDSLTHQNNGIPEPVIETVELPLKDEISYFIVSCFSIYFLYKLFFS